jgi:hypothetical protein
MKRFKQFITETEQITKIWSSAPELNPQGMNWVDSAIEADYEDWGSSSVVNPITPRAFPFANTPPWFPDSTMINAWRYLVNNWMNPNLCLQGYGCGTPQVFYTLYNGFVKSYMFQHGGYWPPYLPISITKDGRQVFIDREQTEFEDEQSSQGPI